MPRYGVIEVSDRMAAYKFEKTKLARIKGEVTTEINGQ